MSSFQVLDPDFESRVRESFAAQKLMRTLRAELTKVAPGEIDIEIPFSDELTQQNGFIHAGVITSIADSACGYAAYTLMAADESVLSVEFKVNLLAPAIGEKFSARAQVIKPGRTLTVCRADVFAINSGEEKMIATMLATMIGRKQ
ncbi:MAG TPA: PaaI family thioesterase [Pyrinomonadaceae bacterium]|jgi:uncharacterized protein (TIGR00369 family)|nr:PaaI family thioesterase [Pyrinomonadaceae bacterium]